MKQKIVNIKEKYVPGMRIRLIKMNDIQALPSGTEGNVLGVDDTGSIMVSWDTGDSPNIIPEVDEIEIVSMNIE